MAGDVGLLLDALPDQSRHLFLPSEHQRPSAQGQTLTAEPHAAPLTRPDPIGKHAQLYMVDDVIAPEAVAPAATSKP